jgi:phenylalanyl-tRNA synthetase beta chain
MLVPFSWLKEYLDISISAEKLAEVLTFAGLEVDRVEKSPLGFTGVVVVKVVQTTPHPEAERLRVARVTDGTHEYQIVCGASNCRENLITALAKVGAQLTDGDGQNFKIKKSKLRGIESEGMLCSSQELGLADEDSGIIELQTDLPLGTDLFELFGDTLFDITLTPNLGHCMSIQGIARELSTLLNVPLKSSKPLVSENADCSIHDLLNVSIDSPAACLHYSCRYIENIEIKPSPQWLQKRLETCGIRSINNIVDITNYILLEYGQPLHAFDFDKIEGGELIITEFAEDSSLTTLDLIERKLPKGSLVITDTKKILAIAGIMGGLSSAITENTTRILVESAYFHPSSIRKTSKALNLRTDASSRFEKTIDPLQVTIALDRAITLIQELAGGQIALGQIDEITHSYTPLQLHCRLSKINSLLGTSLSFNEVENLLHRLKFACTPHYDEEAFTLIIPSYRNDIRAEIDLVEEIARVYGYQHITLKEVKSIHSLLPHSSLYLMEKALRQRLIAEGLQEVLTCDLISPKLATLCVEHITSEDPFIHVLAPSSLDQSILRPSMLPGLLQTLKHNIDPQTDSLAVFEIGLIHYRQNHHFHEKPMVGMLLTGKYASHFWETTQRQVDFFDLKGVLENLFEGLNLSTISYEPSSLQGFHPTRQALITHDHKTLGILGEVHPNLASKLDLKEKIYFAEFSLSELIEPSTHFISMENLPIYPGSYRDWTATFKEATSYSTILNTLKSISSRLVKDISLVNLYRSETLGVDKKNLSFRFVYRDDQKTLSLEMVEKEHARILAFAQQKLKDYLF